MRGQFDIITVPSGDTSSKPAIVLSFDDKKYLFNCGEATQRALVTNKIPMRKIQEIFLSNGWESHGGLASLMLGLTSNDGIRYLGLHGPQNLAYYLATLRAGQQRSYKYKDVLRLSIEEYGLDELQTFEDTNVIIKPILTLPSISRVESSSDQFRDHARNSTSEKDDTDQNLQDHETIHNIAHSVWSGQFLQEQSDGSWTPFKRDFDTSPETIAKDKNIKRQLADEDKVQEDPRKRIKTVTSQHDKFPATPAEHWAFGRYMAKDLPTNFEPFEATISYFIQGQPLPGKFDAQKAKQLGIQPGPAYGRLQRGHSIQTNSGVVHSHQVLGPPRICPPVLIIDCPSHEYIEALCSNEFFKSCKDKNEPSVIVHSCDADVLQDATYINFMSSFGSNVKHLLSSPYFVQDVITNTRAAKHLESLSALSEKIYPSPKTSPPNTEVSYAAYEHAAVNSSPIEAGTRFTPFPYLSMLRQSAKPPETLHEEHQKLLAQYTKSCQNVQQSIALAERDRAAFGPGAEVEILTLGTGSAGPSIYRNVAGTLLVVPNEFSILLDCGEGTAGQLVRAFGVELESALHNLRIIFISHMHADHHLGLIGVIRMWVKHNLKTTSTLFLICPLKYGRSIIEYARIHDIGLERVVIINSACMAHDSSANYSEPNSTVIQKMARLEKNLPGLLKITTSSAIHSEKAMCVRIDHRDGWSVSYSGDTRPCSSFAVMSKDVTCLIHEATFEDNKLDEAVKKKHSTISEALQVSREANAQTTILTHFSQRYPKLPVLNKLPCEELSQRRVGFAVDMMRVKLKDIWTLGLHLQPQLDLAAGLNRLNIQEDDMEVDEVVLDD